MIQKYDSYTSSGIEWIGDIPSHWDLEKVKWIFRHVTEMAEKNNDHELLSVYTDIGVKPRKELKDRGNKATTTDNYWIVKKGDIVVNKLLAWMGAVGLSNYDGVTSPAYDVLRPIRDIDTRYYNYIFRSSQTLSEFKKRSKGIMEMRLRLYFDELGQILFPIPPKKEQEAIADFLDKKCESVDNYILKQKELIELLKEKKSSLINKAVTKGLDPKIEYKDSGIEWLGEIPKHWNVQKLKYILKERNIRSQTGEEILLSLSKEKGIIPKKDLEERSGQAQTLVGYKIVKHLDLVINKMQASNGLINISFIDGITSPDYAVYYSSDKNVDIKYLGYVLVQPKYLLEYKKVSKGVMDGFVRLYSDSLFNVFFLYPPKQEQKQIVEYIEKESSKIDKAISHIEDEIKLLQEYKQSLISSAVTGKIKVV